MRTQPATQAGTPPGPQVATVQLEHEVLGGDPDTTDLAVGATWTFGRGAECSRTLTVASLSRLALALRHEEGGAVRLVSRQSGLGRVHVDADDGRQRHVLALGSAPVLLGPGSWSVRVELPPVVLRMRVHVPARRGAAAGGTGPTGRVSPRAESERTTHSWVPEPGHDAERAWLSVTALAVALTRYPDLTAGPFPGPTSGLGDALRWACGLWCGHASRYWVNERLREAVEAADLALPPGADRLAAVVAHYEPLLPDASLRQVREHLRRLAGEPV